MEEKRHSILIVDDERNVLSAVRRCLRSLPLSIETISDPIEAAATVRERTGTIAAVIADQRMPGMTGLDLLRRVKEVSPHTVRILFTAYTDMEVVIRAINEGEVFRFVRKPWEDAELMGVVLSAIQYHELIEENERLLRTVRAQQETLEELERANPGLTTLPPRDEDGAFIIEPPDGSFSPTW
jgi:response regulator RpfG family c-di-GMP phosphodiesterase